MSSKVRKELMKFQIFSGNSLKIIATVAMMVDHFSKIVLAFITASVWFPNRIAGTMSIEQYTKIDEFIRFTLNKAGGLAFPLFCILVSEGFHYTHDRKKYIKRMFIFALLSEIPFDIGFFSDFSIKMQTFPFYWEYQNVFFTYFLSLLCLYILDKIRTNLDGKGNSKKFCSIILHLLCIATTAYLANYIKCDYGAMGVILIIAFYFLRERRVYQSITLLILYIIMTGNQPTTFIVLAAFIILLYNGSKGKYNFKYFFYLFYPLHIIVFYLFTIILNIVI